MRGFCADADGGVEAVVPALVVGGIFEYEDG
jgi:hypothetical protein